MSSFGNNRLKSVISVSVILNIYKPFPETKIIMFPCVLETEFIVSGNKKMLFPWFLVIENSRFHGKFPWYRYFFVSNFLETTFSQKLCFQKLFSSFWKKKISFQHFWKQLFSAEILFLETTFGHFGNNFFSVSMVFGNKILFPKLAETRIFFGNSCFRGAETAVSKS